MTPTDIEKLKERAEKNARLTIPVVLDFEEALAVVATLSAKDAEIEEWKRQVQTTFAAERRAEAAEAALKEARGLLDMFAVAYENQDIGHKDFRVQVMKRIEEYRSKQDSGGR